MSWKKKTKGYDFLIIDECHRVPTVTCEPVLKTINARYVLGLTATPQRKDRFESISFIQCGPIAYTVEDVNLQSQERKVLFRSTSLPDIVNDDNWDRHPDAKVLYSTISSSSIADDIL